MNEDQEVVTTPISQDNSPKDEKQEFIDIIKTLNSYEIDTLVRSLFKIYFDENEEDDNRRLALLKIEVISYYTPYFDYKYFDQLISVLRFGQEQFSQLALNILLNSFESSPDFANNFFNSASIQKFINCFSIPFNDSMAKVLLALIKKPTLADKLVCLGIFSQFQTLISKIIIVLQRPADVDKTQEIRLMHSIIDIYTELILNIYRDITVTQTAFLELTRFMDLDTFNFYPELFYHSIQFMTKIMPILSIKHDSSSFDLMQAAEQYADLLENGSEEYNLIILEFYRSLATKSNNYSSDEEEDIITQQYNKQRDQLAKSHFVEVIINFYQTWKLNYQSYSCLCRVFICILPVKREYFQMILDNGLIAKFCECFESGSLDILFTVSEFFTLCCLEPFFSICSDFLAENEIIVKIGETLIVTNNNKRIITILHGLCRLVTNLKERNMFSPDNPLAAQFLDLSYEEFVEKKDGIPVEEELYHAITFLENNISQLQ